MRRLFVLALSLTVMLPLLAVLLAFAAATSRAQCGGAVGPGDAPGVPSNLLAIYEQAADSYQLGPAGWAYLAAINEIETSFGHNLSASTAGAIGWMQIMPATWAQYEVSTDPAKPGAPPDPDDPWDAIFTAARSLQQAAPRITQQRSTPHPRRLVRLPGPAAHPGCAQPPAPQPRDPDVDAASAEQVVAAGPATYGPTTASCRTARRRASERARTGAGRDHSSHTDHRHLLDSERQPNMLSTVIGS